MKSKYLVLAAAAAAMFGAGCASVDPRTVPQTAYDTGAPYKLPDEDMPAFKKMIKAKKKSIAVNVDTSPVSKSLVQLSGDGDGDSAASYRRMALATAGGKDFDAGKTNEDADHLAVNLNAELQSALDSLGFLRTVSASDDLLGFVSSGYADGKAAGADIPDYILLCRLTDISTTKEESDSLALDGLALLGAGATAATALGGHRNAAIGLGTATVGAAAAGQVAITQRVEIKCYFELYDRDEGQTKFSKVIKRTERGVSTKGAHQAIQRLMSDAAQEYMRQIASKIGPVGIVVKTTGGGRYAYVSLGEEAGVTPNGMIQVLKREEHDMGDLAVLNYDEEDDDEDGEEGGEETPKKKSAKKTGAQIRIPLESVAVGRVMSSCPPEPTRSWIEILKFDENHPLVKRGMPVRLAPVGGRY